MKLLKTILDLLYPPRCAFCHRLLRDSGETVCKDCAAHLPCTGSLSERPKIRNVERCYAPLFYEKSVRDSLHRYKFGQRTGYAGIYAEYLVKCIDENRISCDIITWAPVSRKRLRERGYDQSELLAREVSKRLGLPCERTLDKIKHTPPQSLRKDAAQRLENVRGAYRLHGGASVSGRRVLLIDDILTSGATLGECAGVLKAAGAAEIIALTVACKR